MQVWQVTDILQDTHGTLWQGDGARRVSGISTDSRSVQAGEMFIALRGERFDGHRFVPEALRQGATVVMVADTQALPTVIPASPHEAPAVVLVPDTLVALQDLARAHRRRFPGKVVAITGSNGKTTVKELVAAVLQTRYRTFKAYGNLNNHIGVPLALLRMALTHEVAVFELGMNHLGEIHHLGGIVQPHIGVITNIGLAHVGLLGSIERIQQAKGELLETLLPGGVAIVNADDPRTLTLGRQAPGRVVGFGQGEGAEVRGRLLEDRGLHGIQCAVQLAGTTWTVELALPGAHNLSNALAAAAVGVVLQVPEAEIVAGLQAYRGMYGRLAIRRGRGEVTLVDDTYNANPQSVRAALQFLAQLPVLGRRMVILADMLELGEAAPQLHYEVGMLVARSQIHHLIVLGEFAADVAQGAGQAGMAAAQVHVVADQQEASRVLASLQQPGDVVLLKGSRGMAMEHLAQALVADAGGC
jgi:UDP-N-acetylmuramoyl-tripeptide--D-alanyl-D-alanine ligase